ncbi:thiamine-phosphate diphosphorylase [Leucobacter massiliensis]|uniref:Thiamine-phosphate synthase n=2 Tax=Leucobacter massiliensis TaxID=1686285 RepID=A0A2S9QS38_9MICO|nr:thiamine-phosphate diphosphorylase [Leucobacter massiliensis]
MLVTDRALCGIRGVGETVRRAVDGGAGTVQLRDKRAGAGELLRQAEQIAGAIDGRAAFVINDRLDVVLAARERGIPVDGVHLGQGDVDVVRARDALGPAAVVGLTAHTPAHLAALAALPRGTVDYLGVGVIRPTSTKRDHPPAIGVAGFARFAAAAPVPCVAIGGVRAADAGALRRAGAAGLAVVSAVCAAQDPERAARELLAAWRNAGAGHANGAGR